MQFHGFQVPARPYFLRCYQGSIAPSAPPPVAISTLLFRGNHNAFVKNAASHLAVPAWLGVDIALGLQVDSLNILLPCINLVEKLPPIVFGPGLCDNWLAVRL